MDSFSVAETAAALGITTKTVYQCIQRGELARVDVPGPILVAAASVRTVQLARSRDAAGRVPQGVTSFAGYIRDRLRPPPFRATVLSDGRTEPAGLQAPARPARDVPMVLSGLPREAAEIWGRTVLTAAAAPSGNGCRWCWARVGARVSGDLPPRNDLATRVLLGGPPCARDAAVLVDEVAQRRLRLAALAQEEERARRARADAIVAAAVAPSRMRRQPAQGALELLTWTGGLAVPVIAQKLGISPSRALVLLSALVRQGVVVVRADGLYARAVTR